MPERKALLVLGSKNEDPRRQIIHTAFSKIASQQGPKSHHPYDVAVLCGGFPLRGLPMAVTMEKFLLKLSHSLTLPRIFRDEKSRNTIESLRNGTDILLRNYPEEDETFLIEVVTESGKEKNAVMVWDRCHFLDHARQRCRLQGSTLLLPDHGKRFHPERPSRERRRFGPSFARPSSLLA